jgi:hypothetical protein
MIIYGYDLIFDFAAYFFPFFEKEVETNSLCIEEMHTSQNPKPPLNTY